MRKTKFEKVKEALKNKTRASNCWVTLTKNVDGRHTGKYCLEGMVNPRNSSISYKTLDEVIEDYNLKI